MTTPERIWTFLRVLDRLVATSFPDAVRPVEIRIEGLDEQTLGAIARALGRPVEAIAGIPGRRVCGRAGGIFITANRGA
jgi:hypothetical protein